MTCNCSAVLANASARNSRSLVFRITLAVCRTRMLPQSRSSAWRVREMAIDEQTLEQLTLAVRRYVRERLVPIDKQIAEEDRIQIGRASGRERGWQYG